MNQSAAVQRQIPYAPDRGASAVGDLFLPPGVLSGVPVLLIHGGGWKSLDKESFEFMAPFFLRGKRPVFNVNYRLLGEAPWPACGDDCLEAGRFILRGGLEPFGLPAPKKLLICGASAGGHLAMMTGLRLPRKNVEAILSMAGPSRIDWVAETRDPIGLSEDFLPQFFGRDVEASGPEARDASPALLREEEPPRLFCLHSRNDELVPLMHSQEAQRSWASRASQAEIFEIDGHGNLHGFWIDGDRDGPLRPEVEEWVAGVLSKL